MALYQLAWRPEVRLWGGELFLVELLILSTCFRGNWRYCILWISLYILTFIMRPFVIFEFVMLVGVAIAGRLTTQRWIDAESVWAQWCLLTISLFAYLSLLYGFHYKMFPPSFWGSMLLTVAATLPFVVARKPVRGLL